MGEQIAVEGSKRVVSNAPELSEEMYAAGSVQGHHPRGPTLGNSLLEYLVDRHLQILKDLGLIDKHQESLMSEVTNGTVKYGRTVKTGDFENKRVDVELSFKIDDGQSQVDVLAVVGQLAVLKAHEILGLQLGTKAEAKPAAAPAASKEAYAAKAAEPEAAAKPRGRPPAKPKPEAAPSAAEVVEPEKQADAAAVTDDDALFSAAEPDVTDAELMSAITKKNAALQNPVAIRQLIGSFFAEPAGKQSRDIPQARRKEFLKKLEELTGAAAKI